jgi:hypothetical protein
MAVLLLINSLSSIAVDMFHLLSSVYLLITCLFHRCLNMEIAALSAVSARPPFAPFISSTFAARQEKLLQGLMQEIIRMTSQKQPLQVGLPLYMWSATTAFAPGQVQASTSNGGSPGHVAPLPVTDFNDTGATTITPSPPPVGGGWSGLPPTATHVIPDHSVSYL